MKLTNTQSMKAKSGMTLLELTVVILVLLSLISILFIGARAWKKGSDRSANIMNIRNTQQAMRGHQNMKELNVGGAFTQTTLETYMKFPKAIGEGTATDGVGYGPGTTGITPQSANPAVGYAHIWIIPTALGLPTAEYGQTLASDSTGW
jgi:prepilin-type N-terminal cleavage/methylation domain-containing protein